MRAPVFAYLAEDGEFPAFLDILPGVGGIGVRVRSREREVNGELVAGATAELELDDGEAVKLAAALVRYLETLSSQGACAFDRQTGILRVAGRDVLRFSQNERAVFALLWPTLGVNSQVPIEALHEALEEKRGRPAAVSVAYAVVQSIRAKLEKTPLLCRNSPGIGYRLYRRDAG